MYEIEHKYLVKDPDTLLPELFNSPFEKKLIKQGYVIDDSKQGILRVRIVDGTIGYLTFKKSTDVSTVKIEIEHEIPINEAILLYDGCKRKISKTRIMVPHENNWWEVDVFDDKLQGLVIAEIEIPSVDTIYNKPEWVSKDVTDIKQLSNYNLTKFSFKDLIQFL